MDGWIGVDLDGTLAEYQGWVSIEHIGNPVPVMLDRVKRWLKDGKEIRIFTARVCPQRDSLEADRARMVIMDWCLEHIGRRLEVTCVKDFGMIELWDDRCIQVELNTGRVVEMEAIGAAVDEEA